MLKFKAKNLKPQTRIELVTFRLPSERSATELLRHSDLSGILFGI